MSDFAVQVGTETFPDWVPKSARYYLFHTEAGLSIRAVARNVGCHASTILRQVRKIENQREDPLVDEALSALSSQHLHLETTKGRAEMSQIEKEKSFDFTDTALRAQAVCILRALCDPGAVLAVAENMEKAVVVTDSTTARTTAQAIDRALAQAMALKAWISASTTGKISRYRITSDGMTALKSMMAEQENKATGFAEDQAQFLATSDAKAQSPRRIRYSTHDSPLTYLARRKDKDGQPFLTEDLVTAGERLREDFEAAQMEPRVTQNWDGFLTGGVSSRQTFGASNAAGSAAAKDRVMLALQDLGPGLGDVALRCCCYLEGMESAEKKMGWSARSGKIVLRIALQRLRRHYDETYGALGPMIG